MARAITTAPYRHTAKVIFFLHYSALCALIGFIFGAASPSYNFYAILKILSIITTGLVVAWLISRVNSLDQKDSSRSRWADSKSSPFHTHHGPQGLYNHRTDHDPTTDHFNNTEFVYDNDRYQL